MAQHNDLGKWGEEQAVSFLKKHGYAIVERDWKLGKMDIDIIALSPDGVEYVFVEVKTRRDDGVAEPSDAVDLKKMRHIGNAADAYVKQNNVVHELRFDIISVVGTSADNMLIEHNMDAFNPLLL